MMTPASVLYSVCDLIHFFPLLCSCELSSIILLGGPQEDLADICLHAFNKVMGVGDHELWEKR